MYGEVPKNEEYKQIDEDFKKECLAKFGSIDSSVAVHIDYAWRYFYNNDLKTAMKRFNQAWLLNAEFPDSYFGFGALMDMQGSAEAARYYKIGGEKDITKIRAKICYQRIADCKEHLHDFKGTVDAYTRLSELEPSNALVFKKIGYFQMQMRHPEDALKAYGKAIDLDATDAVTFNNRGYLQQTQKNYSEAIADYSKAVALDPKYISAFVNRGISRMQIGDAINAKKDFEICVQLDEKSGELRRMLSLAKLSLKDKKGACSDLDLAKQLGDSQADELIQQHCK